MTVSPIVPPGARPPIRRFERIDRAFLFDVGLGLTAIAVAIALNLVR